MIPIANMPVVILRGSDYEMGFQYGEQACAYIDRTREDKWASALRRFITGQPLDLIYSFALSDWAAVRI